MSYYTVRRDDSEIRVVICPACSTPEMGQADVEDTKEYIPYKQDFLFKLMKCNHCGKYFTFYREDGISEIEKDVALKALDNGRCDMRENGKDQHGHSYYMVFKNKPETMTRKQYDQLMGFDEEDPNYPNTKANEDFDKWRKNIPSINQIMRYSHYLANIDFEAMNHYHVGNKKEWFK